MNYKKAYDMRSEFDGIANDFDELCDILNNEVDSNINDWVKSLRAYEKIFAFSDFMSEYIDIQYLYESMIHDDDVQCVGKIFKQRISFIRETSDDILYMTRKWKIDDYRLQKLMDRLEQSILAWLSFIEEEQPDLKEIIDDD